MLKRILALCMACCILLWANHSSSLSPVRPETAIPDQESLREPLQRTAALSTAFAFQGSLSTAAGPVMGICDLRFSLFDAFNGGDLIGVATRNEIVVANGLFAVMLDFGPSAFNTQDRFLEIGVRCPAGSGVFNTLAPRQQVTPTPYALVAEAARTGQDDFTVDGKIWVSESGSFGGAGSMGAITLRAPDLWLQSDSSFGRGDGGRAISHAYNDTLDINHAGDFSGGVVIGSNTRVNGAIDVQGSASFGATSSLAALTLRAPDVYLNANSYFGRGVGGRALSHEFGDILSINHLGDFDGGVKIWGETIIQGWKLHLNGADFTMNAGLPRGDGGRALVHFDNDTLVVNLAGDFGGGVKIDSRATVNGAMNVAGDLTAEGDAIRLLGTDLVISAGGDRGIGGRALVHDNGNTLSINHLGDFTGGVKIWGNATVKGWQLQLEGPEFRMNAGGNRGDGGRALAHDINDTLVLNYGGDFAGGVRIDGETTIKSNLYVEGGRIDFKGTDFYMRASGRGDGGRALVHDIQDTLTINYDRDFAGGVRVNDLRAGKVIEENLMTEAQQMDLALLPFTQGDVLCWDGDQQQLARCDAAASPLVVAVSDDRGMPIVLGAEPIKVVGAVQPGDLLVSADAPGYAMAWSQTGGNMPPPGTVIAKALDSSAGGQRMIKAMIFLR